MPGHTHQEQPVNPNAHVLDLATAVETYQAIRSAAYQIAIADGGAAMGVYAWLRNALGENDIEFTPTDDGLLCHGKTWSGAAQDWEDFEFTISTQTLTDHLNA